MTIEELLNCSADELEKMSDAELEAHFAPYLNITRPELAKKETSERVFKPSNSRSSSGAPRKEDITQTAAYKRAQELAKQMGLKI